MRIGILTFHYADNYGAILQIYGLKKACELLGYSTHVLDYAPKYISKHYRVFSVTKDLKLNLIKLRNIFGNIRKRLKFDSFRRGNFDIVPFHAGSYDAVIYGSDQIWNPDISQGFDPVFFGVHTMETEKRISYAASIGKQSLTAQEKEQLSELLLPLDTISVREETARNLLSEITDKPIAVTMDPTLLLPAEEWIKITLHNHRLPAEYILIYEVYRLPETKKVAQELSQKTGLPIIELVYDKTKLRVPHLQLNNAGPLDFLCLIKQARYVVTSSFHGTAFSIIFRKDFYTVLHDTYGNRMSDLLSRLSLRNRIVTACPNIIETVDYNSVEEELSRLKEYSVSFIRNAVEGEFRTV